MKRQAESLGLKTRASFVDIGVRVELPAVVLKAVTDTTYESKLLHYSKTFDERVRTFCMNPYGEVVTEKNDERRESLKKMFYTEAAQRGVLYHPNHCWFLSLGHTSGDVEKTLEVSRDSLKQAKKAL